MSSYPHTTLWQVLSLPLLYQELSGEWGPQQGKKNPLRHRLLPALRELTPQRQSLCGGHAAPPPSDGPAPSWPQGC